MRTMLAVARRAARPYRVPLQVAALLVVALTCQDVTVTPVAVRNVAVTPTDTTLTVGEELELTAVVTDEAGNRLRGRAVTWSSENDDVVSVSPTGGVVAVGRGEASVTAAVDGRSGTATIQVTEPPDEEVARVEVDPDTTSIGIGKTVELEAIARSEDGTALGGREASWSSDNEAVATVDAEGVATGVAAGVAEITATIDNVSGTASVTVTEVVQPVASVEIEPADTSIVIGATVALKAIARSEDGTELGGHEVSWSSDNEAIATVDAEGVVTGVAEGEVRITAAIDSISDTADITVSMLSVDSVVVVPAESSLLVDDTVRLQATTLAANGDTLTGRAASWESGDPAVATVDGAGLVTGVAEGETEITATVEGVAGRARVTVSLIPVESVEVVPADTSILVGETAELVAIATSAAGDTLAGREVEWSSDSTDIATIDAAGLVTGVAAGTATITATIGGVVDSASVTVEVVPVASVAIEPADTTLAEGDSATLHAIVTDADGNELTDRAIAWQSSSSVATVTAVSPPDAIATAGSCPIGQVSCDAEISATADSVTGAAAITVEKVAATVTVTPAGPIELYPDSVVALTAVVLASDGTDLTSVKPVTWSSGDEAIAVVDPTTGQVTAVGAPCAPPQPSCGVTITATVDEASAQVEIRVLKPVASVTISPADTTLRPLTAATFIATLAAADGTLLPGRTAFWSWAGGSTSASPCGSDSGQVQISLNPVEGVSDANGAVSTTATVVSGPLAPGYVWIWAEAEGATGCATLRVSLL